MLSFHSRKTWTNQEVVTNRRCCLNCRPLEGRLERRQPKWPQTQGQATEASARWLPKQAGPASPVTPLVSQKCTMYKCTVALLTDSFSAASVCSSTPESHEHTEGAEFCLLLASSMLYAHLVAKTSLHSSNTNVVCHQKVLL